MPIIDTSVNIIDIEGSDSDLASALENLKEYSVEMKVIGSYPRYVKAENATGVYGIGL